MGLAISGLPDVSNLNNVRREPTITYVDRSGVMIGMRGGRYGPPVDLNRLPAYVPAAFVSIEDRRFYEHMGFDPVGIARAVAADITKGRTAEGASTITQQLARNLFLTPDQTMERKAQELALAVMIEQKYTKKQILALYLSRVYFGNGAYGLEAASQRYFGKPAAKLSIAEAAALAGVLKSPTHYNPLDEPQRSAERAKIVLAAMVDTGAITEAQRRKAEAHPIRVYAQAASASAQYFVDWVDGQTRSFLGGAPKQDLVVQTTLDLPLEEIAAKTTASVVARDARQGVQQAALVALDSAGRVRSMVGGVDYGESQFNRAVAAHRQAGSSWKPFVYLTAMEAGQTPEMQVVDEPVTINGWSPHNYEPEYLGTITLQDALAHSVNTVAARLADQVGRNNVAQTAKRLGISSPINTDPAMALGTTQVTPLEMAQAYSTFADGGLGSSAYGVESIKTSAGKVLFQHRAQPQPQLIANPALSEMNQMLRAVVTSGTGVHDAIPGYDIAGKTGTTSDYKDAWFCGFTGGFTTVVWVGRDDSTPMIRVAGAGAPSEIWRGFMGAALPRVRPTAIPPGPPPPAPVLPPADSVAVAAAPPVVEADPETPSAPPQR
ncbi:PBP1A family penicillin-binding protein [Phenylobacterium montanum]|uniref:PBP1A family penicillin-binding protein n=2 Tax=Phenylobacterium montanum TaxID=2823693 RepID=A0A975IX17_9CAUL|nr:PBP1A family penicillin-binding protein [Caulobacter sp. S6]